MSASSSRAGGRSASLTVPCHVSERWLRFEEREQFEVLDEDLIQLDVMTRDDDGEPYKLCELVVARGDLLRAVAAYGDPPFRTAPVRRKTAAPEPAAPRRKKPSSGGAPDQPTLTEP
ncbi:MAG TPA: hypothetical protein VHG09_12165 [Longimicrobiales bacterium]|nr:hypothetical protein [Longimicrobiales bacterium]